VRECVAAVVTEHGSILLARRSPGRAFYPDCWDLIGGHIELNETPVETLVRELKEEVGIVPTQWAYWDTFEEPYPMQHGPGLYHIYVVFVWSGTPSNRQLSEHTEIGWFSYRDAIRLKLAHPQYADLFTRLESWQVS